MFRWLVVLCAAGCGRLQFDERLTNDATVSNDAKACVALGHDEDGDGVDDACDVCPATADDQRDTDGDGVGDACDPLPTASERIVFFDPFLTTNAEWAYGSIAQVTNDSLVIPALGRGTTSELITPPSGERYRIVGGVGNVGTGNRQLSIQIGSTGAGRYYCELFEDPTRRYISITDTLDGNTYNSLAKQALVAPFANGPVVLTFDHRPPNLICSASWGALEYEINATVPSGIAANKVFLAVTDANVVLTSFTRISSTP